MVDNAEKKSLAKAHFIQRHTDLWITA